MEGFVGSTEERERGLWALSVKGGQGKQGQADACVVKNTKRSSPTGCTKHEEG